MHEIAASKQFRVIGDCQSPTLNAEVQVGYRIDNVVIQLKPFCAIDRAFDVNVGNGDGPHTGSLVKLMDEAFAH
jgi:hypothetical protein